MVILESFITKDLTTGGEWRGMDGTTTESYETSVRIDLWSSVRVSVLGYFYRSSVDFHILRIDFQISKTLKILGHNLKMKEYVNQKHVNQTHRSINTVSNISMFREPQKE